METVDQFMERFRATGLHMLTEARRRELAYIPNVLFWGRTEYRWSMPGPNLQQISKAYVHDEMWLGMDYSGIEDRILAMTTPEGPYKDRFRRMFETGPATYIIESDSGEIRRMEPVYNWPLHAYQEQAINRLTREARNQRIVIDLESWRERVFTGGRRLSHRLQSLSAAFAFAAASLGTAFDGETMIPSKALFYDEIEPHKPPGRSLGPGREVEEPGERRVNPRRIAKDRLRKKLARKSKRK